MDSIILVMVLMLVSVGIVMIFSSSYYRTMDTNRLHYATMQSTAAIAGLFLMLFAAFFKYDLLKKLIYPGYILACGAVAYASFRGPERFGARRWIDLTRFGIPFENFQPSEFMMIMVVFTLALFLSTRASNLDIHVERMMFRIPANTAKPEREQLRKSHTNTYNLQTLIVASLLIIIPVLLINRGVNTSTVIITTIVGCVIIFLSSKLIIRYLLAGGALVAAGGFSAYFLAVVLQIEGNAFARIRMFFESTDSTALTQTDMSLIAVGSGGMFGLGLGESLQKFGTLPHAHNDFIFAIIIEELGLFGAGIILFMFGILIWRGIVAARNAKDLFGTLIAAGAVTLIAVQVLVGVGVTVDALPNTGSPIPFISYGGTSVLFNLALVGVLLNVSRYTKEKPNIGEIIIPHRKRSG